MKGVERIYLFAVLLGLSILVAGCNTRDLSRPSTRLVGHWAYFRSGDTAPAYESYFGKADEEGVGSYVLADQEETVYAKYRILSESKNMVTIGVFVGTSPSAIKEEIIVSEDGQTLTYMETATWK